MLFILETNSLKSGIYCTIAFDLYRMGFSAGLNRIQVYQGSMDNSRSRHSRQVMSRTYPPCRELKYFAIANITLGYADKAVSSFFTQNLCFPLCYMLIFCIP